MFTENGEYRQELQTQMFRIMDGILSEEQRRTFAAVPESQLEQYAWGYAAIIRLRMLGSRSRLYHYYCMQGIRERDTMVLLVLTDYHHYLQWPRDWGEEGERGRAQTGGSGA